MEDYQPIENYGVIGDLNTVALVGLNGSIDFMCFPDFDSPSIFAALLDNKKGGFFKISPLADGVKQKQLYLPDTNVLLTRFLGDNGISETTDFMPVHDMNEGQKLIRIATCVHGNVELQVECLPSFNYGKSSFTYNTITENEVHFLIDGDDNKIIRLVSTIPIQVDENGVHAIFKLKTGQRATFLLELVKDGPIAQEQLNDNAEKLLYQTINYWKDWTGQSLYRGRWMEIVNRSALVLKLMTSAKYGSIVASPTFGLPEEIGGERNWDYRYTWIRDASFTIYTLLKLGYKKEAREFIHWVEKRCDYIGDAGSLRLMYGIDGRMELFEESIDLEGYKKSSPVRIGNGAYDQVQLDIYGELLDAVYLFDKYGETISYDFWKDLAKQVDWVCEHWQIPDEGIWEVRGGKKEFLYSRLLCWVALDRGIRLAETHSFPYPGTWRTVRDKIFTSIHEEFWNDKIQAFVQYKGADTVDAATLLMPLVRFIGPKDPKWLSTLKRIEEELVSDSLVYRYRNDDKLDGLAGAEGTFSMCTFWYVECLSLAGQLNKARLYFEKMLGYANHLGLYSEMLGLKGDHLGNFPQAFTHLGLISAALSLDKQFSDQRNKDENSRH
jgi:GH15 family glucan-1,4-alpha-glucosidase